MALKVEKRTTDPEFLNNPRSHYMLLTGDAVRQIAPLLDELVPSVTYYNYYGSFSGAPGMDLWFGFSTRADREQAQASGVTEKIRAIARSALVAWGYPASSVTTELMIDFTSEEEIAAGGGEFAFFR